MSKLTSSPWVNPGDSHPHEWAFLLRGDLPGLAFTAPGLTASPQAATASPAAKMFLAALISRSCWTPHSGQVQKRISSGKESRTCPQSKQRFEEGYHLSILTKVLPYHCALYSSCLTNSDHPTSEIALAREWFWTMFLTCKPSTHTIWFSRMILVESFC